MIAYREGAVAITHEGRSPLVTWYRWVPRTSALVVVEPGATHDYARDLIELLAAASYDPVGNGRSFHRDVSAPSLELALAELARVLDALPGVRDVVTHQSAALPAAHLLARQPGRYRLTMVSPRLGPPSDHLDPFAAHEGRSGGHEATCAWIAAFPDRLAYWRKTVVPNAPVVACAMATALIDADDDDAAATARAFGAATLTLGVGGALARLTPHAATQISRYLTR